MVRAPPLGEPIIAAPERTVAPVGRTSAALEPVDVLTGAAAETDGAPPSAPLATETLTEDPASPAWALGAASRIAAMTATLPEFIKRVNDLDFIVLLSREALPARI
jgi:hypothetical protein